LTNGQTILGKQITPSENQKLDEPHAIAKKTNEQQNKTKHRKDR
jgi:hypothetical protein